MVLMCCVRSCKTKHSKSSDTKFHKFPRNEELRSKWLLAINNESWFVPSQHSVVCSKHFDTDDYKINAFRNKKLKINAIPKSTLSRRSTRSLLEDFEVLHHSKEDNTNTIIFDSKDSNVLEYTGVVNNINVEDNVLSETLNNSKSIVLIASSNSGMDLDNSIILGQLEENMSINSTTSQKRKLFRYLGDYEKDLETPRKRKMFWSVYKKTFEKKVNTKRLLRQKNRRLQAKIKTLNTLIDNLQAENKITANCSNISMITYD